MLLLFKRCSSSIAICFTVLLAACGGSQSNSTDPGNASQKPNLSSCYKADEFICQVEAAIVVHTNIKRQSLGLSPLQQAFESSFAARDWSISQAQAGVISHAGFPNARQELIRQEFDQLNIFLRAENVAVGYPGSEDPTAIAAYFVDLWWNSPGHRANMVGNFSYLGAGIALGESSGPWKVYYATQLFH